MGINVSAADLNKFATGMIEDAESALNNGIITKNLPWANGVLEMVQTGKQLL